MRILGIRLVANGRARRGELRAVRLVDLEVRPAGRRAGERQAGNAHTEALVGGRGEYHPVRAGRGAERDGRGRAIDAQHRIGRHAHEGRQGRDSGRHQDGIGSRRRQLRQVDGRPVAVPDIAGEELRILRRVHLVGHRGVRGRVDQLLELQRVVRVLRAVEENQAMRGGRAELEVLACAARGQPNGSCDVARAVSRGNDDEVRGAYARSRRVGDGDSSRAGGRWNGERERGGTCDRRCGRGGIELGRDRCGRIEVCADHGHHGARHSGCRRERGDGRRTRYRDDEVRGARGRGSAHGHRYTARRRAGWHGDHDRPRVGGADGGRRSVEPDRVVRRGWAEADSMDRHHRPDGAAARRHRRDRKARSRLPPYLRDVAGSVIHVLDDVAGTDRGRRAGQRDCEQGRFHPACAIGNFGQSVATRRVPAILNTGLHAAAFPGGRTREAGTCIRTSNGREISKR